MAFKEEKYLFCGIGGSGMSALAKVLLSHGAKVYGSDRSYDSGLHGEMFKSLQDRGVVIVPQDGSGISDDLTALVVSSAVEDSILDVKAAKEKNVPIMLRAELLAKLANAASSVTVAGTNGKSTTTAMIGWVLHQAGLEPTIINGGGMLNFAADNAVVGSSDWLVAETDESDGSVTLFSPKIAVLTNISEDHKGMDELITIFKQYLSQSEQQVLNIDCPIVKELAKDFPDAVLYSSKQETIELMVPGAHNQSNAQAALMAAKLCGVSHEDAIKALASFKGVSSRLEVIGMVNDIIVIDDFAHNPDKIAASLLSLQESKKGRLLLMYQAHGFGPTKRQKGSLIEVFSKGITKDDVFFMPEIFYAGGTADKTISASDIINPLKEKGINANFHQDKNSIYTALLDTVKMGDIICIMGARDNSLRQMSRDIFAALSMRKEA